MRVDVHQHVWTTALVDRLATRDRLPLIERQGDLTVLHSAGELPYVIDTASETPDLRARSVRDDELDLALVAISSPIGIEALPREDALELIDAQLDGVLALPDEFAAWGPIALDRAEPAQVDSLLGRGCVGISIASGAIEGPDRLYQMGPVLERVAERGVPLFVHPGLAPGQFAATAALDEPIWWRPLTAYVAQMQAAWLTFAGIGRRELPDLKVIFAMLGGGAPLLSERLSARGGPAIELDDPNTFYETSSYGAAAVEMMVRRVGASQLLYGSDRPVIEPHATERDRSLQTNAGDLITVVNV